MDECVVEGSQDVANSEYVLVLFGSASLGGSVVNELFILAFYFFFAFFAFSSGSFLLVSLL